MKYGDDLHDAVAWHRSGLLDKASAVYQDAISASRNRADARFLLGVMCLQQKRLDDAEEHLGKAAQMSPTDPMVCNALGNLSCERGDFVSACAAFRRATEAAPDLLDGWHNLGRAARHAGDLEGALAALKQAETLAPNSATVLADIGVVLKDLRRHDAAEAAWRRALELAPRNQQAQTNIAVLFSEQGRADDAAEIGERVTDPVSRFVMSLVIPAVPWSDAEIEASREAYRRGLAKAPAIVVPDPVAGIGALGHFYLAYQDRPLKALHEATAAAYRKVCPSLEYVATHCRRDGRLVSQRRRPRLVVISSHLHDHTIARLFAGLITGLAAKQFEVIVALGPRCRPDSVTAALKGGVDGLIQLPADLAGARAMVSELEADAIFYPDLGMEPFTYFLAFARLAPLQFTTWGHPVTTGLQTIDGFLSADYLDPPGVEDEYSETLYRLPAPAFYFDRPDVPDIQRGHFGLVSTERVYICPQTLFKLHPGFDRLLGGILAADPKAVIVLLAGGVPAHRQRLEARLKEHFGGAAAERVWFLPQLSRTDFLGALAASDVMLDIPSFSGGNTTLEGLAAGTPIVTLPGSHLRGRLTASILRMAGLEQGIAGDEGDYVRRAVAFANDGAEYRRAIASQAGGLYRRRQAVDDVAEVVMEQLLDRPHLPEATGAVTGIGKT